MKVKDLIECLHQCDPEAIVLQGGGDVCGYFEVGLREITKVLPDVYNDNVNGHYEKLENVKRRLRYNDPSWGLKQDEVKRLEQILKTEPIKAVII